jgi:aerobic carbon-monoxide dehydrogenase small subunit
MKREIISKINGKVFRFEAEDTSTVLQVLREVLYLTGTKEGCGTGDCGACTILWNGKAVNACLLLANRMENAEIWTIEGLMQNGKLHPIQEAYIEAGAIQCGYCSPGFVVRTKALLDEIPDPTDNDIIQGLAGNLCRCTGYQNIIKAVQLAKKKLKVRSTA